MKWVVVWIWWGWLCAVVPNTQRPTEQLSGKSAQSITNTQTFVHENQNQYFSAPEEFFFFIKRIKTHLLIYHSQRTQLSSWQVSLTCFTHLITTCLQAPVMNEPRRAAYAHTITNLKILDTSLQSGLKKKKKIHKLCNNDIFPTHARGYIFKNNRKPVKCK